MEEMDEIVVLIALGPNDIEVPCMLFKSYEEGENFCRKILGATNKGAGRYAFDGELMNKKFADNPIASKIFTYYYPGCGFCWGVEIRKVKFNKPFTRWDLD
jgi:hypothetical protein